MPPRKEPCRNFQRGNCQYGDRCKFLHVTQQQPRPNGFGFGAQTDNQFQRSNSQQQKPNPFGFGVQGNKPFENKWTRNPTNTGGSQASRQPDNQPPAANHKCTDPESCKRQISEDFDKERPLWKLTCYGHGKSSSCDIVRDISFEELRAVAYDDAKRGLSLPSIVERERSLLNAKLLEFESLLRNPYVIPQSSANATQSANSADATQSAFSGTTQRSVFGATQSVSSMTAQNSTPPPVSSFNQLGASLNTGFGMRPVTPPNNAFHSFQNVSQTTNPFGTKNSPFGTAGSLGSQPHNQSFGNPFAINSATVGSSASGTNSTSSAVGQWSANVNIIGNMTKENGEVDNSIWLKEEWNRGEIPEEAPPDKYVF